MNRILKKFYTSTTIKSCRLKKKAILKPCIRNIRSKKSSKLKRKNMTLQNLMIKPYSIISIMTVKTLAWFSYNFIKTLIILCITSFFSIDNLFNASYVYVVFFVCAGIMGASYILSSLTLIFTKIASFIIIISYVFLFLSGSIFPIPDFSVYANPLSAGVNYISLIMTDSVTTADFVLLLVICASWYFAGYVIF